MESFFHMHYILSDHELFLRKNGIKFTTDTFQIMSEMGGKTYSGVDIAAWNKTFMEGITDKSATWERSISGQYTLASGGPYCDCGYKKKG